jgi:class 3 adenylate cyclase/pimeloyl-ACP methyl ester carboxylesterase
MARPEVKYAKNGDVHLAYEVFGDGPIDVMFVPGFVSNLEDMWALPGLAEPMLQLASQVRVIRYDKRGTGQSDREALTGTLDERMDDIRAVLDAVGSQRTALVGTSEGGPLAALFAATYQDRTQALVLAGTWAHVPDEMREVFGAFGDYMSSLWGTGRGLLTFFNPEDGMDAETLAPVERHSASVGAIKRIVDMMRDTDVSAVLPTINAPTLVLSSPDDRQIPIMFGEFIAEQIPGAVMQLMSGSHGMLAIGAELPRRVGEFVTGVPASYDIDRVLSTVVFTDIVDSTARASRVGDGAWRRILDDHDSLVGRLVNAARGQVVKQTGDGVLASFDGPARAVRCAQDIVREAHRLDLDVRAGVHTGECERRQDDLGGIAVHVGARVAALAQPSEVLVTRMVKDLVAGSGLVFEDRGEHELKGVPDRWQLFRATA